jgi:hypothetical protein
MLEKKKAQKKTVIDGEYSLTSVRGTKLLQDN